MESVEEKLHRVIKLLNRLQAEGNDKIGVKRLINMINNLDYTESGAPNDGFWIERVVEYRQELRYTLVAVEGINLNNEPARRYLKAKSEELYFQIENLYSMVDFKLKDELEYIYERLVRADHSTKWAAITVLDFFKKQARHYLQITDKLE